MSDQTKDIIAIITEAIKHFKDGKYEKVQETLKDNGFSKAIKQMQETDLQNVSKTVDDDDLKKAFSDLFSKVGYGQANSVLKNNNALEKIEDADIKIAFANFFEKIDNDKLQTILANDDYKIIIKQNIESEKLQNIAANLREHMGTATSANVVKRLTQTEIEYANQLFAVFEKKLQENNLIEIINKGFGNFETVALEQIKNMPNYDQIKSFATNSDFIKKLESYPDSNLKQSIIKLQSAITRNDKNCNISYYPDGFLDQMLQLEIVEVKNAINNSGLKANHIANIGNGFSGFVHKINDIMQEQADILTKIEEKSFGEKGWFGYNLDLTKSRWKGEHGREWQFEVEAPKPPTTKGFNSINLLGTNVAENTEGIPNIPTTQTITKTIKLEDKAIEEFGKGDFTLLDTKWKKFQAGASLFAGVGIAVHGIYNIYAAINQNIAKNAESSGTENNKAENDNHQDGINWLRLVVGAGEIGVGTIITTRQLIGRHIWELNKPIQGSFTPLCNHGNASNGHGVV
jgi:hypothetical protein